MSGAKKDRSARRRHAKAVQKRITEKLKAWHHKHKDDVEYRLKRAEGSRRHLEQVYRDAELGRMARVMLAGLGEVLARLADLKRLAEDCAVNGAARGGGVGAGRGETTDKGDERW